MSNIIKLFKRAYDISRGIVELLGVFLLIILVVYSTVYLKGVVPSDSKIDIGKLVSSDTAYIWVAIFVVYSGGLLVSLGISIRKAIIKARDKSIKPKEKAGSFLKWILNHL